MDRGLGYSNPFLSASWRRCLKRFTVARAFGLTVNRVRGLLNVEVYALLSVLCCVLNREAAENLGRPEKALSPTFFNV